MKKKFLILPAKGLLARVSENASVNPNVTDFLATLSGNTRSAKPLSLKTSRLAKALPIDVLDSVHEDGVKLVEMDTESISELAAAFPGVRVVPEVFFSKAIAPRKRIAVISKKTRGVRKVKLTVVGENGEAVPGAEVIAFTNFAAREGTEGKTSASGKVILTFERLTSSIQRIYIYPRDTFWPLFKKNINLKQSELSIALQSIVVPYKDVIRHFYKNSQLPPVNGTIKVAIIDTGVGLHKELNVVDGECTVQGEPDDDFTDYDGHGTHVAGIVSSFATTMQNTPAVELYSYRVFPKKGGGASNYSIVKAIDRAVAAGCHLINMSLGGDREDDGTKEAIMDAHSKGVICFVATGNEDRSSVCFPASFSLSLAVSAMGRKGTFPKDTEPEDCVAAPYGKDKKNFIASFSNVGPEVKLVAPGVGVVSCAPNNKYAVMNGTSMACPAATGIAARLLVGEGKIMRQAPSAQRADDMIKFLAIKMKSLGFKPRFEGKGMIL